MNHFECKEMIVNNGSQVWIEQRNFVFDCVSQFLINSIEVTDEPLALLVMLILFDSLDVKTAAKATLEKLRKSVEALPSINNSGLRQRDCLLVIGYDLWKNSSSWSVDDTPDVSPYLKHALEQNWFGDPRLATVAFWLSHDSISTAAAVDFVEHQISDWLAQDFALGVICSCLIETIDISDDRIDYLAQRDWEDDLVETISLGLLAATKLIGEGHRLVQLRNRLAKLILHKLRENNLCTGTLHSEMTIGGEEIATSTVYETALALYALRVSKFDRIYGVLFDSYKTLDALVRLWRRIEAGGVVVSKRWLLFFQLSVFANFFLLAWWLITKVGIGELYSAILGLVVTALLMALGQILFRKGMPTVTLLSTLFGEINQSTTFSEELDESDQPSRRLDSQ